MFYAMGCVVHGDFRTVGDLRKPCRYLSIETTPSDKNIYGEVYEVKMNRFNTMIKNIVKHCPEIDCVELMYQCDFEKELHEPGTEIYKFFNNADNGITAKTKPPPTFSPRAGKEVYKIHYMRDKKNSKFLKFC